MKRAPIGAVKDAISPDKDLDGEPRIANALNVEESIVSIGAVLVQRPVGHISSSRAHSDIPGEEIIDMKWDLEDDNCKEFTLS